MRLLDTDRRVARPRFWRAGFCLFPPLSDSSHYPQPNQRLRYALNTYLTGKQKCDIWCFSLGTIRSVPRLPLMARRLPFSNLALQFCPVLRRGTTPSVSSLATHHSPLATVFYFQSLTSIKLSNPCVLRTIRNAGAWVCPPTGSPFFFAFLTVSCELSTVGLRKSFRMRTYEPLATH
jgi:hypothetical protein